MSLKQASSETVNHCSEISVYHRTGKTGGIKKQRYRVTKTFKTVQDLKTKLLNAIYNHGTHRYVEGLTISENQVRVECMQAGDSLFCEGSVELKNDDYLINGSSYVVVETFSITPSALFRTVGLHQNHPSVYVQQGIATDFTPVAPVYTAAIRDDKEGKWPPVEEIGSRIKFHGISLYTDHTCAGYYKTEFPQGFNPFEQENTFQKGGYTMGAGEFADLVEPSGVIAQNNIILNNTTFLDVTTPRFKQSVQKVDGGKKKIFYYMHVLRPLNVESLGMRLVFDASTEGHASLIRLENVQKHYLWDQGVVPVVYNPRLPDPTEGQLQGSYAALRQQPQPFSVLIGFGNQITFFPCIASKFEFHSFKMQASAEPKAPKDPNDDSWKLYEAATVLYHVSCEPTAFLAISKLENASFNPEELGEDFFWTLSTLKSELENLYQDIEEIDANTSEKLVTKLNLSDFPQDDITHRESEIKKRSWNVSIEGCNVLQSYLNSPGERSIARTSSMCSQDLEKSSPFLSH